MESKKSPEADLVAIYRLEFYKKQKRWKLSSDAKKIKLEKNTEVKNQLNTTYDVAVPKTESSQLNDAFLESDPDKSKTVLSSQLSEQNVTSVTQYSSYKCQTTFNNWEGIVQTQNELNRNVHTEQRFPETDIQVTLEDNIACDQAERDCLDFNESLECNNRWPDNNNWRNTPGLDELWCNDPPGNINGQYCGDNATNLLFASEDYQHDNIWSPEYENLLWINENLYSNIGAEEWCEDNEQSTDSWGDFMRGADIAPHSSELELAVPNPINVNSLATLSSSQLNAAVRSHTKVLYSLLQEERLRKRQRSRLSLTTCTSSRPLFSSRPATVNSNYERPTHDYDHSIYHTAINTLQRERTFTRTFDDVFVAGSHINGDLELLGRGRGRLQCATGDNAGRVVGVGRGRPFRL